MSGATGLLLFPALGWSKSCLGHPASHWSGSCLGFLVLMSPISPSIVTCPCPGESCHSKSCLVPCLGLASPARPKSWFLTGSSVLGVMLPQGSCSSDCSASHLILFYPSGVPPVLFCLRLACLISGSGMDCAGQVSGPKHLDHDMTPILR